MGHADRRGNGGPSAPAVQHKGPADGPLSSTVSQDPVRSKHKSGSVGAVDPTAGPGAKQSRPGRRRCRRG